MKEGGRRGKQSHAEENKTRTKKSTLTKMSAADYRGTAAPKCKQNTKNF